ncbi:MAG: flavocytochrome c [Limnochordia bacterium]|jgi:urocanate reductase
MRRLGLFLLIACLLASAGVRAQVLEYDVVVVGGGGAGLVAAAAAAEKGQQVLVLEKMAFVGGNTLVSGGVCNAVYPPWQEPLGIEDSIEFHYQQTLAGGDYRGNPDLIRVLVEGAPAALDRSRERGLTFHPDGVFQVLGALWPRTHRPMESAGTGWIRIYLEAAKKAGAHVLLNTRVIGLLRQEPLAGRVYGVKAISSDGKQLEIHARKGVVLATGGFGANVEMRTLHNPLLGPGFPTTNQPGTMGDGITMAQDVGADVTGMDFIQLIPAGCPKTGAVTGTVGAGIASSIMINKKGERFVNEGERRDVLSNAVFQQPDGLYYTINDSRVVPEVTSWGERPTDLVAEGRVFKAGTLKELAELIGVPAKALAATVARYNESVRSGEDRDFGKPAHLLKAAIEEPPFYAVPRVPSVHHTMGGVVINRHAQVIDRRGQIIPGLYAAGEVTGGIHGTNRLGGNAIADIAVFGWIAGENAAAGN